MTERQEIPEKNKEEHSGLYSYLENDNAYRSLFKDSHAVMLLIDPETSDIVDANLAACDFYGWPYEELRNKKIHQINTLTNEKVKAEMKNAVEEKRNYFFFKHRLANGEIRDVEVYSSPIVINSRNLLYSIIHDITERKLAEEELKKKKLQLSNAQKIGHVGSYEIDLNSGKVDASEEAARIYGLKDKELDFGLCRNPRYSGGI
ncbi:PAS domain S-box protein [Methanolobus sp. ZRKC3]|uniref:PAS domain-containing protein n=1 Tax=Methanolobus sp. ZRKC3 TaxID=3125786 RepID=UPI003246B1AF